MRAFAGVLGGIIALFSSFFVAAALADIARGGDGKTGVPVLVGLLVFFTGTMLAGGYLAWRMFRRSGRAAPAAVYALA